MPTDTSQPRVLVAVLVYNEGAKLRLTLERFPEDRKYDVVVMDDGSTDDAPDVAREFPFHYIRSDTNRGVGAAIRTVIDYAEAEGYEILVPMAGNAKMHPVHIPSLLKPILEGGFDYVQGSRYLEGGKSENLPLFRRLTIPAFTGVVWLLTGYKGTDVTCGMRAYRLAILHHPKVNLRQDWLNRYEMEYYIHYYAIKLGFKITEAPVAMTYPPDMKNYSKIKAITGWWSMIRPWVFLSFRIKR